MSGGTAAITALIFQWLSISRHSENGQRHVLSGALLEKSREDEIEVWQWWGHCHA
jgi:hypothetical protein